MKARFKVVLDAEIEIPHADTLEEGIALARQMQFQDIFPARGRKFEANDWKVELIGVDDYERVMEGTL